MNDRKTLWKGIAIGFIALFAIQFVGSSFVSAFRSYQYVEMDPEKKMNEIFSLLDTYYIDDYDRTVVLDTMYKGMVYGVGDVYTTYMNQEELASFNEQTQGEYAGIGVVVTINEETNQIEVVSAYEGSPGNLAGILPGDEIIKVNGFDVSADTFEDAISMMKGKPGTSVNITIHRPSDDTTFDLDVVREDINVPTVNHEMLEDNIGYIQLTSFDGVTDEQFMTAYEDLTLQDMQGLIIDVRNNPGGFLHVVVEIADVLVPEGNILYTETKDGTKKYYPSDAEHIEIPLVLLVNGNSASASEVLAGAVKDMGVGTLVGTQTYGKGVVQDLFTLSDGSAIKMTVSRYYTPSGVSIHGEGITPDYIVEMDDAKTAQIGSLSLEEDVQLQKGIEVIQMQIAEE